MPIPAATPEDTQTPAGWQRRHVLKAGGVLVSPDTVANIGKIQAKTVNVALLGVLSTHLDIPALLWEEAIRANLAEKHHKLNIEAFQRGREAVRDAQA